MTIAIAIFAQIESVGCNKLGTLLKHTLYCCIAILSLKTLYLLKILVTKKYIIQLWPHSTKTQLKCLGGLLITISSVITHYTACQVRSTDSPLHLETYFTPEDPCLDLIVSKIQSAQKLILVHAYVITSRKIAYALIEAHHKKLNVQLLVDKNAQASKGSKVNWLLKQGIPIIIDKTTGLAHNKIIIIDDIYVITGSFNWTECAQTKNSKNILIITGKEPNRKFKSNWYRRAIAGKPLN